jgi:hypothetical protein
MVPSGRQSPTISKNMLSQRWVLVVAREGQDKIALRWMGTCPPAL